VWRILSIQAHLRARAMMVDALTRLLYHRWHAAFTRHASFSKSVRHA